MENSVEFKNISKRFSGVQALDKISFRADGGEITALLGENGAGKSTLLKIMSGAYIPDEGCCSINNEDVVFSSTTDAIKAGISIIYQERQLVNELTVAENVFMDELPHNKFGIVDFALANSETQKLIDLFNLPFKATDKVKHLSVAYQQMVEIMKAYRRNSKIIAFDEPTAALSEAEINALFKLILQLKDEGKVVLYVSHRLDELFQITDKVVIFKDGTFVEEIRTKDATPPRLIKSMVGRDIGDVFKGLKRNDKMGDVVLEVKDLNNDYLKDVSFSLKKGQVLGFAGLVGAGRSETMKAIFGEDKLNSGEIFIDGKKVNIKSVPDAIKAGIGLCPEDRKEEGLVLRRSVNDNVTVVTLKELSNRGVIDHKKEKEVSTKAVEQYRIKTPTIEKIVGELSGGNQQKVILGRWLSANLKVLILDEPTKGIDVGAKAEIYQMICDLAKEGLGVIFISSELPEVINVSDNVVVMREGQVTGILNRDEVSEELILSLAMDNTDVKDDEQKKAALN